MDDGNILKLLATIALVVVACAVVKLMFGIGVLVGIIIALLVFLFWPGIIELFI